MKLRVNAIAQVCTMAGQILIPAIPISDEWKAFAHALVGFISAAVGIIAHSFTPDGQKL